MSPHQVSDLQGIIYEWTRANVRDIVCNTVKWRYVWSTPPDPIWGSVDIAIDVVPPCDEWMTRELVDELEQ